MGALARAILSQAPPAADRVDARDAHLERRLGALPAHRHREFGHAIGLLASPLGVLLAGLPPRAFAALAPATQQRCLGAWMDSPLPIVRSAVQAVRKLVQSVHYARPDVLAVIGYAGGLRHRAPALPWEGPLPAGSPADAPDAAGPVARQPLVIAPHPTPAVDPPGLVRHTAVTTDTHRTADVVVVGSGAGGAVMAAHLAEAGLEVVVLESGGWHDRRDFAEDEAAMAARLMADGGLRSTDDGSVLIVQGDTVGGSTTVNWMIMLRTPDAVLDEWARDAGTEGMTPRDMAPVFDEVERTVHARLVPDAAHSANNRIVLDGARALGWRARGGAINARGCVRCGFCSAGCSHDAKQSALVTWLPRALAAGATLYERATALRIEPRERDTGSYTSSGTPPMKRVHVAIGAHGGAGRARTLTIDAPLVVVAAGAVGTPVLLERSGLGGGGVGQYLRLHPVTGVMGRYDRPIVTSTGIPLTTVCDEHTRFDGTDYGFWIETPPMHPWFMAAALPYVGRAHAAHMTAHAQLGVLIGLTRDGAALRHSSGRVRLNRHGAVSIGYRLHDSDARRVRASIAATAQLHIAAGAREVATLHAPPRVARHAREVAALAEGSVAPNRLGLFSAHVNGTCRIGTDARTSGAAPDGQRHGVRGLYISDGALLPTAPGANPQETIMAVATVLARRLVDRHAPRAAVGAAPRHSESRDHAQG